MVADLMWGQPWHLPKNPLLEAAYALDSQQLARARLLLRVHLLLHPRDPRALACAATVCNASGHPAKALCQAHCALERLRSDDYPALRLALEGDGLETGLKAACRLHGRTASTQKRSALEKTILEWLLRRGKLEPDAADQLRQEPGLEDLQDRLDHLLHYCYAIHALGRQS